MTRNCWHPNAWSADWQTGRGAYATVRSVIIFEYPSAPVSHGGGLCPLRGPVCFGSHEPCAIGAYLSFDIKPLIHLDISFAMGRGRLPT
jgi:hypothetical protein